jgi:VanZ family protein
VLSVLLVVQVAGLYSPTVPGPDGAAGLDKVAHLVGFALPTLVAGLLRARWVVVLLLLHAVVSEPLQGWLAPLRSPDPVDALADLAGVALGLGLATALSARGARARGSGKMDA